LESAEQYKNNGDKKPPFSYSTLICMAMKAKGNKVTLSSIYGWIRENFLYYRNADPSWKVIIGSYLIKNFIKCKSFTFYGFFFLFLLRIRSDTIYR